MIWLIQPDQPLGRYRIVLDQDNGAQTRLSFTLGFEGGKRSPGRPDLVKVTLDKPEYGPGDTMNVNVAAHFSGQLMLVVASDKVHQVLNVPIGKEPKTVAGKRRAEVGEVPLDGCGLVAVLPEPRCIAADGALAELP